MKDTYRYFIHAYEDAKWKRPLNHQHGGPPSSPTAPGRSGGPKSSPESPPTGGSTSTSSTGGRRSRRRGEQREERSLRDHLF